MKLEAELTEINGVGEATAAKIMEIVDDTDASDAKENLEDALDYFDAGNPEYAEKFVRRAYEGL